METSKSRTNIAQASPLSGTEPHRINALTPSQIVLLWAGILIVAAAVRLATWSDVFAPDRIRFMADTDPHYHVLRALSIVENFPRLPWTDPAMNHPTGAVILWPPLFDLLIAVPAKLLGGSPRVVELVAVWLPVVLGLLALALVGALGSAFGAPHIGLTAAALLALLPANIEYTILGRPDQHAMELVASSWVFLGFLYAWRKKTTWISAAPLGLAITVAFWNWQGSGFYLVLLVGFIFLWHLLGFSAGETAHPACALARGATVGCLMLGLSVTLFTSHGLRTMHIMGVTGFHVIMVGITALFCWGLLWFANIRQRQASSWRLILEGTISGFVPLLLALTLIPGFQRGVNQGLTALTASSPWYSVIDEFAPLLFDAVKPVSVELASLFRHFGLLLLVAPLCAVAVVKRWHEKREMKPEMLFLLYWGSTLFVLTFLRVRFNLYAVVPLALWVAIALEELGIWTRGHPLGIFTPPLAAALVLAPALSFPAPKTFREDPLVTMSAPVLRWLRGAPITAPDRQAVLAPWSLGHAVLYFARKPVLTTPFGADGGPGAMEDSGRFFLAADPDAAELLLEQRQVAYVLLANPADEVYTLYPLSGSTAPSPVQLVPDVVNGATFFVTDAFSSLVASRLYFQDGSRAPPLPALSAYRLLFETPPLVGVAGPAQRQIKLFGVVRGATVQVVGAQADSTVVARIPLRTNQGRVFVWTTAAGSDAHGQARIRIPYATGENGLIRTLPCTISDGTRATEISLTESSVVRGEAVIVDLSANKTVYPGRAEVGGPKR